MFGDPARISIMRATCWPSYFSGFCTSLSVHALEHYNNPRLDGLPSVEKLGEEALLHFSEDFELSVHPKADWPESFFTNSQLYDSHLFLEALYYAIFRADFTMQTSDEKEHYMPFRNDCIDAIDVFLVDGLGYKKMIKQINQTIAARSALYGQNEPKSPILFAVNIVEYIPRPDVFAMRTHAYFSVAVLKTLCPIFMNLAPEKNGIRIRCRKCQALIEPKIEQAPVTIRCGNCQHQYRVDGVWTT